jgi:succinoglycan biosynthesis protein ExoA
MTTPVSCTRRVSIVSPCRNERNFILDFVETLFAQELPSGYQLEVLIAEGMSDDGTREILIGCAECHPNLRIIDNPRKIVSTGLNEAIRAATGDIIVRMDAHTTYARDYVRRCVETLECTGADNVGGPARTLANGYFQESIRLGYHSPFGVGGARFHDIDYEGLVDTVTYGCWRKTTLEVVGLFDEELVRNQDDELNLRIVRSGGKVWQSSAIRSWYYPRDSLTKLFSQYMQYGYWKVRVIQKHKIPASIRHLVPGSFVFCLIVLGMLAPFWRSASWLLAFLLAAYGAINVAASLITCMKGGERKYFPIMPVVFACYHLGYGYGFLRGAIDFLILRRHGHTSFSSLTRDSGTTVQTKENTNE